MNINQLARNQQMMYNFINRGASGIDRTQLQSQSSSLGSLFLKNGADDAVSGMLQSMGISGMQGRTVREMAQYQIRTQKTAGTANAAQTSGTANAAQTQTTSTAQANAAGKTGFSVRERYTPISDKATKAMQKLALDDAKNSVKKKDAAAEKKEAAEQKDAAEKKDDAKSANGANNANGAAERDTIIREHLKEVEPSKRTAAYNTMNKVWENETDRIGKYIKEKTPGWNDWGDEFDTSILDQYEAGVNVFV